MKKLTSVFLSLIIVLSTFSVFTTVVSAATYTTGYYASSSNSGSNIRSGPGSKYSRVGAVSKGVKFYVSKVNGEWGYSSSISSTTGVKSGWVSLKYCTKVSSGHTHSYTGGRYYEKAHPHAITVRCSDYANCKGYKVTGEYHKVKNCNKCYPTHTHSYTGGRYYEKAHPHRISVRCTNYSSCGSWKWTNEYYKLKSCSQCYPTNNKPKTTIKLNVPLYKQNDSRWKNVYIGNKTIGAIGCTTTCIAMVYSYNTGKTVYPNVVMKKLKYSNNDLYWSSISSVGLTSKAYNCKMSNSIMSTIYSKLKAGKPVIIGATTSSGGSQHWVVITGYIGSSTTTFSTADFIINDPGTQDCNTLKEFLANGNSTDRTQIVRIMY